MVGLFTYTALVTKQELEEYACIYIKYLQIFKKLEEVYDQMCHPQKRMDVKKVCHTCSCSRSHLYAALVPPSSPSSRPAPPILLLVDLLCVCALVKRLTLARRFAAVRSNWWRVWAVYLSCGTG